MILIFLHIKDRPRSLNSQEANEDDPNENSSDLLFPPQFLGLQFRILSAIPFDLIIQWFVLDSRIIIMIIQPDGRGICENRTETAFVWHGIKVLRMILDFPFHSDRD